jgi:PIN domain-containing protein
VPPVVVFDTNILFSAIGWRGRPYECLEHARSGRVAGMTCQELLDELTDKLRAKLAFTDEQLAETLADLLASFRWSLSRTHSMASAPILTMTRCLSAPLSAGRHTSSAVTAATFCRSVATRASRS